MILYFFLGIYGCELIVSQFTTVISIFVILALWNLNLCFIHRFIHRSVFKVFIFMYSLLPILASFTFIQIEISSHYIPSSTHLGSGTLRISSILHFTSNHQLVETGRRKYLFPLCHPIPTSLVNILVIVVIKSIQNMKNLYKICSVVIKY